MTEEPRHSGLRPAARAHPSERAAAEPLDLLRYRLAAGLIEGIHALDEPTEEDAVAIVDAVALLLVCVAVGAEVPRKTVLELIEKQSEELGLR